MFENEAETHPAFGMASVSRVHSTPGITLFDSEIQHGEFVELKIMSADRRRDIKRDWIHDTTIHTVVRMSMAQWGALVSSFNTSGVPVTLEMVRDGDLIEVEDLPYEPRMAESLKEIHAATGQLVDDIKKAVIAVREAYDLNKGRTVINEALRHLEITIINSQPNADYAAKTFAEHVENTVTKARADIEAMAQTAARAGLESGAARLLEIEANDA